MSRNTRHPNRLAALPKGSKHWNYNENPNILTMHKRIHRKYGAAKNHLCFDCGKQAIDWSLEGSNYSDNVEDYKPRCRSCHVKLDMTRERRRKISVGLKRAYAEGRR